MRVVMLPNQAHPITAPLQRAGRTPLVTAAREIRARMKDVDRRLAEVETFYVSSNPRLTAEIERLR